jgi:signal transduction histidine kinase
MEKTILVIDDEQRLAESLAALLREEGYDVDAAVGGREGLRKIQENPPALVITDLRMPEIDGFQIMDYVSKNLPGTALIVITGHASTQSAIEAIHQRVADYLTKPFEFDYLVASIEKVFAQVEADELRRDMIRMISHDIKVPLNSIMGFAQFIVDRKTGQVSPKAADYAEKIVLNSQRILGLLDNYLTHARAESGRLEIMAQPMSLEGAVEEAVKLMTSEFHRKNIDLRSDIVRIGKWINADEHLVFRALANLLNNAAKYTPEGGWTTVSVGPVTDPEIGAAARVAIENSGPGIEARDLTRVFDKYRRSASSRGMEGAGLGLYVVKHVAEAHGGRIEVESEPNVRTCFRLILPLDTKAETG